MWKLKKMYSSLHILYPQNTLKAAYYFLWEAQLVKQSLCLRNPIYVYSRLSVNLILRMQIKLTQGQMQTKCLYLYNSSVALDLLEIILLGYIILDWIHKNSRNRTFYITLDHTLYSINYDRTQDSTCSLLYHECNLLIYMTCIEYHEFVNVWVLCKWVCV